MGNILTKCCILDNIEHDKQKNKTPLSALEPSTFPRSSSPSRDIRTHPVTSSSRSQDQEFLTTSAAGVSRFQSSAPRKGSTAPGSGNATDQRVNTTTNLSSQSTPQPRTKNNSNDNKSLPITLAKKFSASLQNLTQSSRRGQSRRSSSGKSHHTASSTNHTTTLQSLSLAQGLAHSPYTLSDEEIKVLLANEIPPSEIERISIGVDAGGMGIIHVAEWKGIKIAIKEASSHVISKEVEIYNRMRGYDGVVQFYGVTYPPQVDKLCIVTKYAENGSLSWYLKTTFHKLTWADKLRLATQITSSIAKLHQEGIYHRDLHGGNILIDGTGKAMLTDFGASTVIEERVARSMDEFAIATLTTPEGKSKFVSEKIPGEGESNKVVVSSPSTSSPSSPPPPSLSPPVDNIGECSGTTAVATGSRRRAIGSRSSNIDEKHDPLIGVMAYIAPERFRNPRYFDARCDIYSLGVLLWELTSGHSAFSRVPQDVQLAVAILNGKREDPIEGTPESYRALYERCWESDPEMRPSLDEILSTISEIHASLSKEQLAVTRERNVVRRDDGTEFEESLSIPRPTSDYQKYLMPE
ncbi:MAG: kinase-like domain-containing protein [Benniella sp.]|nr:MAG: kinase-like domain-containing protein [Benniella sp.]